MKQALHILRKDLRHQWADIALYVTILVLFSVTTPMVADGKRVSNTVLPLLAMLLRILVPLSWVIIGIRLVHEESLVGDRQFWTTRPYRWQSLMAAKLLFLVLCIQVPYIIMQCIMAISAGASPLNGGLTITALEVWIVPLLPLFLVATVTATLANAFFAVIGTLLLWAAALTFVIGRDDPRTDAPYARLVLSMFFALVFLGLLTYQYRRRNTQLSRIAMLSIVVVFLALYIGYVQMSLPFLGNALMHSRYPRNGAPELHLVFVPSAQHISGDAKHHKADSLLYVTLPIHLDGLNAANRLTDLNAAYTVEANGEQYASPWRPVALTLDSMSLLVPQRFLEYAAGNATHLQLTLAGTMLGPASTQTVAVSDHFSVGDNSACNSIEGFGNMVRCGFAFQAPDPIRIDPIAPATCPPGTLQSAAIRTLDAGSTIDPVRYQAFNFGGKADCHVTSVRFTVYKPTKRFSTILDIPVVNLNSYVDR